MIKLSPHQKQVIQHIAQPIGPTELARAMGTTKGAAYRALRRMEMKGRLKHVSPGRYWFVYPEIDGVDA